MAKMMDAIPVMTNCGVTMKMLWMPWDERRLNIKKAALRMEDER